MNLYYILLLIIIYPFVSSLIKLIKAWFWTCKDFAVPDVLKFALKPFGNRSVYMKFLAMDGCLRAEGSVCKWVSAVLFSVSTIKGNIDSLEHPHTCRWERVMKRIKADKDQMNNSVLNKRIWEQRIELCKPFFLKLS